jgi:hypothetical protein
MTIKVFFEEIDQKTFEPNEFSFVKNLPKYKNFIKAKKY